MEFGRATSTNQPLPGPVPGTTGVTYISIPPEWPKPVVVNEPPPEPTWRHRIVYFVAWLVGVEVVLERKPPDKTQWWTVKYFSRFSGEYVWKVLRAEHRPSMDVWKGVIGPFDSEKEAKAQIGYS